MCERPLWWYQLLFSALLIVENLSFHISQVVISPQKRNEEKDKLLRDAEELKKKIATLKAATSKANATRKPEASGMRKPAQKSAARKSAAAKVSVLQVNLKGGPMFRTGFSILSAKGFRWVGGS